MINSFKQYLVEEQGTVYFAFGRMNPPTIGHGKLLDKLASVAGRNPYRLFLSQSNDKKDNPVEYLNKVKHVRKMFPKHARYVMINKKVKTPWDALSALYDEGFRKVIMVAGSDRVQEYDIRLNMYNGKKGAYGFYNFESGIKVVSAGQRDPDAKGAEGASGTKQRGYAADNNFTGFSQGLPKTMSTGDAKRLFNDVRKGMGLKEEKAFRNHVQLPPVSSLREAYVKDGLFEQGDEVVMLKHERVGVIKHLGANYVIVESKGDTWRCWLNDITKVDSETKIEYEEAPYKDPGDDGVIREEYKYEWGTDASAKHAKKMTPGQNEGLWANMHAKRARGEKMRKKNAKGAPTPDQIKRAQNEATTPQDNDIADRIGTQPARYHKGLSKATKAVRDRQFKKQAKMADDNPAAYKDAPGDKEARKRDMPLSKNTKFVNDLMGESLDRVRDRNSAEKQRTADQHRKDKEKMKIAHDRRVDRARRQATMQKNQGLDEGSFADKSKASGISTGTLKKVYNRGVAAWKTGHRPGTTPQQWGHARVNAFIRKKKQGGLNHDKDLA